MNPNETPAKTSPRAMSAMTAAVAISAALLLLSIFNGSSSNEAGGMGASLLFLFALFAAPITAVVSFASANTALKTNPSNKRLAAWFITLAIINLLAVGAVLVVMQSQYHIW